MTIKHHQALGYTTERLADAVSNGEVEPFLIGYIYPSGPRLTLEEAAARLEVKPEALVALRAALGWTREDYLEGDLRLVESFQAIAGRRTGRQPSPGQQTGVLR